MSKSIMYRSKEECFICRKQTALEEHHVWHGTANRRLSDKDGLTVYLCPECHRRLHDKGIADKSLMAIGQAYWMMQYEMTEDDFRKRYGRSLL